MKISLNSILIILVLIVLIFFFLADKSGTYLNGSEVQVYLLIAVTLVSLFINSRFNNEFIEILNVFFVGFYICRIPFIFSDGVISDVLLREVDVRNIPWYLIVLAVQYLFLLLCILAINPRIPRKNISSFISESIFKRILLFSSIVVAVNLVRTFFFFDIHGGTLSHIPAILKTIFTENNVLMLIFLSSLMVEKEVFRKYKYAIGGIVLFALFPSIHEGSKSGLLQAMLLVYLALLVVRGPLVLRLRGLLVMGAVGIGTFFLFFVGKVTRLFYVNDFAFAPQRFVFLFRKFFVEDMNTTDLLNAFSYRIGYLDFFIQKISNPVYEPYVNFTYYFKALVDKMTPGFDVFGVPFASRAIYSAYHGPSVNVLNSEVITVFGEGYLLFGFFSFVLYLVILLLIKMAFLYFKASSGAAFGLFYMYIIFSFYWWLTGSGLDMLIALAMYQGIFVFFIISLICFWSRKEKINILTYFPFLSKVIMGIQRRDNP